MVLAITVWNPLLQIPVYFASYRLGCMLLGQTPTIRSDSAWLTLLTESTQSFMVGNLILGVIISTASYLLIHRITLLHRRKKAVRELLQLYQLNETTQKSY